MARRRRRRTGRRRSSYRRLHRRFRGRRGIPTSVQRIRIASDRQVVRLKYIKILNMSSIATYQQYDFRINSLFDPDLSVGGSQPVGYQQWAAFYNRYRVFAVRYRCQALSNNSNGALGLVAIPQNGTVAFGGPVSALNQTRAKASRISSTANMSSQVYGKVYMPALNGQTRQQYMASDDSQASTGGNPATELTLSVFTYMVDGSTAISCNLQVEIQFYAEFFDRIPLAPT